jgi:hypothetical protein
MSHTIKCTVSQRHQLFDFFVALRVTTYSACTCCYPFALLLHLPYCHYLPYLAITCPTYSTCPTCITVLQSLSFSAHATSATITYYKYHHLSHITTKWSSCHLSLTRWHKLHCRTTLRCMLDQPLRTCNGYTVSHILKCVTYSQNTLQHTPIRNICGQ